jgi:autotransporter-associated beta strand protein
MPLFTVCKKRWMVDILSRQTTKPHPICRDIPGNIYRKLRVCFTSGKSGIADMFCVARMCMNYGRIPRFLLILAILSGLPSLSRAFTTNDTAIIFNAYSNAFYSLNGTNASFNNNQTGGTTYFWGQAEEIECVLDAYEWTSNATYKVMITNLLDGFANNNGTNWSYDSYNDDCMWACMAFARGYQDTGNPWFLAIAKTNFDMVYARGWDTSLGGMWWTTGDTNKVAAVNGPAAIAAYLLYQGLNNSAYLTKSTNIYNWEKTNLFVAGTGMIYDGEGSSGIPGGAPTTYDQGTFIGAANFLGLTNDAMQAANYTMNSMTSGGILPQYGIANNNSGFNAIFFRWMARFVKNQGLQSAYQQWLQDNANAAWNLRRALDNLSWCQWLQQTPTGTNFYSWDCIASMEALQVVPPTQSTSPGTVTLMTSDAPGATSYTNSGNWSSGAAPVWSNNYVVAGLNLRTPADSSYHTFAGSSLILTNGGALRLTTSGGAAITVGTALSIYNGIVSAWTRPAVLGGSVILQSGGGVFDPQSLGGFTITAPISGGGPLTVASDNSTFGGTLFLSGNNTYTGGTIINGPDTLTLTNNGTLGSTNGNLTFNNNGNGLMIPYTTYSTASYGTLNLNGISLGVGNLSGGGGKILNNTTNGTVVLTLGSGNNGGGNYSGVILDHTTGSGAIALVKTGSGTITLSGAGNTCSGGLTVNGGDLIVTNVGSLAIGSGTGTTMSVGSGNFGSGVLNGVLDVSSASNFTANVGTIQVGVNAATAGTVSGSAGILNLGTNNTLTATTSIIIGDSAGAFNTTLQTVTTVANGVTTIATPNLTIGGRKANTTFVLGNGSQLKVGTTGSRTAFGVGNAAPLGQSGTGTSFSATNDLSAGIFTGFLSQLLIGTINNTGAGGEAGSMILSASAVNHLDISGGGNVVLLGTNSTVNSATATGTLTISNLDLASTVTSTNNSTAILLGATANSAGILNLDGGTLTVTTTGSAIGGGAGTSTVNFNGTTLKAGAGSSSFIAGLKAANVFGGGVIINNNGNSITIPQSLVSGVINDGGLTKVGAGTLTLTGTNTYVGWTTIGAGTLALSSSGSIANTPVISIGSGATFDVSGLSSTFALGAGQILAGGGVTGTVSGNLNANAGSLVLNYISGTPALSVVNGTVTMNNNAVTITNLGSALPVGSYMLISAGIAGGVAGLVTNSIVTVVGGGVAGGQPASLGINGGALYLVVGAPSFSISNTFNSSTMTLTWPGGGQLLQTTNLLVSWTTNVGATSPFVVTPTNNQMFFRVQH